MTRAELIQAIVEDLAKCQRPAMSPIWKDSGLSHAQLGMLYMLSYHHQASVKQIAEFLGVTKSAVTQLMDPLVDKALVDRRNDSKDRRIVRLSLTPSGSKLLKRLNKYKFAGIRSALDSLDTKDLQQMHRLYQKMSAKIVKQN